MDLRKLGIQRWWMFARDRQSWKKVLGEAKVLLVVVPLVVVVVVMVVIMVMMMATLSIIMPMMLVRSNIYILLQLPQTTFQN
jgi:hypothetical protein